MLAQIHSFVLQGIEPGLCEVEVDIDGTDLSSKPTIVGLPDAAVKESLERVRSALTNSGYPFPDARLLINLAPADIRKEGPSYDLPIALGFLLGQNVIRSQRHHDLLFAGELALDGRLRPISGVINLAILAKTNGMRGVVVPADNAQEASAVDGIAVYPAQTLAQVAAFLNEQEQTIAPLAQADVDQLLQATHCPVDFSDIRGQEAVKRAITIAAAGGHNVLMISPV